VDQTQTDDVSREAIHEETSSSEETEPFGEPKRSFPIRTLILTAALSTGLHLVFGWAWTLGAGVLGGLLRPSRGPAVGALGVGGAWTGLLGYTFFVAPASTAILLDVLAGLLGRNTPDALIVFITIFFGVTLGALGGTIGSQLRRLFRSQEPARA